MSGFGSGSDQSAHIRAVSQNIRHCRCDSFLYGNSDTPLSQGTKGHLSADFLFLSVLLEELSSTDVYLVLFFFIVTTEENVVAN